MKFPLFIDLRSNKGMDCPGLVMIKVRENEYGAYYWRPAGIWGTSVNENLEVVSKLEYTKHLDGLQATKSTITDFLISNGDYSLRKDCYDIVTGEAYNNLLELIDHINKLVY